MNRVQRRRKERTTRSVLVGQSPRWAAGPCPAGPSRPRIRSEAHESWLERTEGSVCLVASDARWFIVLWRGHLLTAMVEWQHVMQKDPEKRLGGRNMGGTGQMRGQFAIEKGGVKGWSLLP